MTNGKKRERPLGLDMEPDEAFERFMGVDPNEIDESKKLKKKPPPKRGSGIKRKAGPKPKP